MQPFVIRYNVETIIRGDPMYLQSNGQWSIHPDYAFEYASLDEAEDDAEKHGGEVFKFERPARVGDIELVRIPSRYAKPDPVEPPALRSAVVNVTEHA